MGAALDVLRQMARETSRLCSLGQMMFANGVYKVLKLGHGRMDLYLSSTNVFTSGLGSYLIYYLVK